MKRLFKNLTKRLTLFILAIILVGGPILYLLSLNSNSAKAAWYNDNWAYRKAITVTVTSSSSDITNLQTLLTVDTSTDMSGKIQSACQDLRFTSASGKLLPYYIDSGCTGTTSKIWVMADLVPKNTDTYTMYMYYGNPTAPAVTDAATFWGVKNLAGYWTMNETSWNGTSGEIKDSSINATNGVAAKTGSPSVPSTTAGKYSNAGSFTATSYGNMQFANMGNILNMGSSQSFTISVWAKFSTQDSNNNYPGIVCKGNTQTTPIRYCLSINITTNIPGFAIGDGTNGAGVNTLVRMDDNSWHNYVGVVNRTDQTLSLYVDGVLQGSTSTSSVGSLSNANSLYIGARQDDAGAYNGLTGSVDDMRIYTRALSGTEAQQLYTNPGTITTTATTSSRPTSSFASEETTPGPIAYWKFDEGTGTIAQDSTQQNKDGAISGATWQTEDQCVFGKCLSFDGSNDVVTVSSTVSSIKTVSFWVKPLTTSEQLIDINGTASISISSGTISATSFTSPTIYVNGKVSSTLTANTWQFVTVTTGTALSGSAIKVGQISSNYGQIFVDELKMYGYARSSAQVLTDYNSRGGGEGSSATLSQNQQNNPSALNNGLVGYWKMDESSGNLTDSSGNGNTGTVTGTTVAAGRFGNGRDFNGTTDYADAGSATTLDNTILSVTTWVKADTISGQAVNYIASKFTDDDGVNDQGWALGFLGTTGSCGGVDGTPLVYDTTNNTLLCATTVISTGSWYHLAFTYDGTIGKIYVNGVLENSAAMTITEAAGTSLNIGRRSDAVFYLDGKMDDTRIYNRVLSPAEVSQLYNFAPGPVGYWNFDENNGTSAKDTSGNGNTGTLTAGPTWAQGKYGAGINLDGTDDYIDMGSPSTLDNIPVKTVEFWTKLDAQLCSTCTVGSHFINKGDSSWFIATDPVNSRNIYGHNFSGTSGRWSFPQFSLNTWHHVVVAYDRTSVSSDPVIYVDGVSQTVTEYSTPVGTTTDDSSDSFLVSKSPGNTRWVDGRIDEVKVYNYIRTTKQITEDMNAGHPAVGSPIGSAIGHWKFDEGNGTAANNTGNQGSALNGTLTNMASPATTTSGWTQSGKFGKALSFDGSNDYVNTNYTKTSGDGTFSVWFKGGTQTSGSSSVVRPIVVQGTFDGAGTTYPEGILINMYRDGFANHGKLSFEWGEENAAGAITTTNTYNDNNWHHAVLTKSGTTATAYVDGVLIGSFTAVDAVDTSTPVLIGGSTTNSVRYFTGQIDEVKIYNYALSADQVKLDMNRGQAQLLGALSDNSSYEKQAANQEYCVPGDTTSCDAPVARWDFQEGQGQTTYDTSGNGFNGTIGATGSVASDDPTRAFGKVGRGLTFDGVDDSVKVGDGTKLQNMFDSGGTVETWVKLRSDGGGDIGRIVDKFINNTGGWIVNPSGESDGKVKIGFTQDFSTTDGSWVSTSTEITLNTWTHVAITYNSSSTSNDPTIYVNGKSVTLTEGSTPAGTRNSDAGIDLYIGNNSFVTRSTDGTLDQIRLFNYARSAAQVAWDYNNGKPFGHWRLDECQGDRANDSSGNSNTGTITVGASGTYTSLGTCASSSASTMWYNGATGKYNGSLAFDGTDDYVDMGNSSTFNIGSSGFTLSTWAKRSASDSVGVLIKKGTGAASGYVLALGGGCSTNQLKLSKYGVVDICTGTFPADTNWHLITEVINTDNTITLYVDGVVSGTSSDTQAFSSSSDNLQVGGSTTSDNVTFAGQIDDVQIYNYALTATQVKNLYNGGGSVRFGPLTGSP